MANFTGPKRYLGQTAEQLGRFRATAESYPGLLSTSEALGLFTKPFDRSSGHASFFFPMFQVLNMLRVLQLETGARIMEVGSGPGWVTEILVGLGYCVEAIEPSSEMIDAAKDRVSKFKDKHRFAECLVTFHQSTLEEFDCHSVAPVDAVLFYESLHHLADEAAGLKIAFNVLKPGGLVGITGEGNWQPGNAEQEALLLKEIERFGTLESPFTFEYLEFVLGEAGFTGITRYHGVNGFYPVEAENTPLKDVADLSARFCNNVTAIRPAVVDSASGSWLTIGKRIWEKFCRRLPDPDRCRPLLVDVHRLPEPPPTRHGSRSSLGSKMNFMSALHQSFKWY
jgi:SAM-dependent methyltransferase